MMLSVMSSILINKAVGFLRMPTSGGRRLMTSYVRLVTATASPAPVSAAQKPLILLDVDGVIVQSFGSVQTYTARSTSPKRI